VIARNSVFQYKGRAVDVRDVGRELEVRYVLEGSVQRAGDSIRINAQLIDAATGYHLWAEKYDRPLADIFALQDDISRRIAESLQVALGPAGRPGEHPPTRSLEAYDAYLRAQSHSHRGLEAADVDRAIATFERAIALDPDFSRAHAELASAYVVKYFHFDPSPEWEKRAAVHIEKALSLDPHLPEAYVARGNLEWTLAHGFPHEKAVADFRRALEINPSLAEAHRYLGRVYYHLGFFEKSLEEFRQALRADPKDLWVLYRIGNVHLYDMEPAKVVAHTDKLPETAFSGEKGLALSYLGRDKEALAITEAALKREPNNEDNLAIHAVLLARKGDREGAERAIALSIASGKGRGHFHHDEYWFGAAYALLGQKKEAVSWLENAADHGFPCYPYFQKDPYLDPLRGDPEFQKLLLRMKKQWDEWRATL
jgi:adenylate cyclase